MSETRTQNEPADALPISVVPVVASSLTMTSWQSLPFHVPKMRLTDAALSGARESRSTGAWPARSVDEDVAGRAEER